MIECAFNHFNSGSTIASTLGEDDRYEIEEQLYAQMMGWA